MPLPLAPIGKSLSIKRVGGESRVVKHLASLGLVEGASIMLLESTSGGVVLNVLGSRLALGKDVARSILVLPSQA